jgi:signal peptidase II
MTVPLARSIDHAKGMITTLAGKTPQASFPIGAEFNVDVPPSADPSTREAVPRFGERATEHLLGCSTVEDRECEVTRERLRPVLDDASARLHDAPRVARDGSSPLEGNADAHGLVELAGHLCREAKLPEERDDRPRRDFVRERRDEPAVHDARGSLITVFRDKLGHHVTALGLEGETKADWVVWAAAKAGLAGAKDRAVHARREYAVCGRGCKTGMQRLRAFLVIALCAGLFGCDHASKLCAQTILGSGRIVTVVPSVLELRYAKNTDVAFSAMSQWDIPHKALLLMVVAVLVLVLAIAMWVRHRVGARRAAMGTWGLTDVGFALVLAGAFGNVIDRLARGYVVDFIHVSHWPIFNVADVCIVVGLIALGLSRSRVRAAPVTGAG